MHYTYKYKILLLALSITVVISLNKDDIFAYWAERKTETETAIRKKKDEK